MKFFCVCGMSNKRIQLYNRSLQFSSTIQKKTLPILQWEHDWIFLCEMSVKLLGIGSFFWISMRRTILYISAPQWSEGQQRIEWVKRIHFHLIFLFNFIHSFFFYYSFDIVYQWYFCKIYTIQILDFLIRYHVNYFYW